MSIEFDEAQIAAWRRMSPLEKLQEVSRLNSEAHELALADIRRRYPAANERECFLRLAAIRIGVDTVRRMYPDAAALSDLRGADPLSWSSRAA